MKVMLFDPTDDIETLRPLLQEWKLLANGSEFNFPLDVDITMQTARSMVTGTSSELLVAVDSDGMVWGFIGAIFKNSHVGPGLIANECLFFVSLKKKGCGISLLRAFRRLAKGRGCSHMILNASRLAADNDKSGRIFTAFGLKPVETAYIGAL